MRIIARSSLRDFWEKYPDSEQSLKAWFYEASRAQWQSPSDIKSLYRNASIIANNRVVFNIKGNDYRLIVHVRDRSLQEHHSHYKSEDRATDCYM